MQVFWGVVSAAGKIKKLYITPTSLKVEDIPEYKIISHVILWNLKQNNGNNKSVDNTEI